MDSCGCSLCSIARPYTPIGHAQTPEQFYKGRQLTMIVYTGTASAYDVYARLLVRHLVNHIPGKPTFIVQNMQGAGVLKAIGIQGQVMSVQTVATIVGTPADVAD